MRIRTSALTLEAKTLKSFSTPLIGRVRVRQTAIATLPGADSVTEVLPNRMYVEVDRRLY